MCQDYILPRAGASNLSYGSADNIDDLHKHTNTANKDKENLKK